MKLIFQIALTFISFAAYSQQIIIENSQSRILYAGAENPIKIHMHGYKSSELNISVNHGEIIKKDNEGAYTWKICDVNNQSRSILKIYKGNKLIDSIIFKLKALPDPTILIPSNGHRSHAGQIVFRGIRAEIENFSIEGIPCEIISYDFGLLKKTDSIFKIINNKGAYFGKNAKDLFSTAGSGDEYLVKNIIVKVGCLPYFLKIEKEYRSILY